MVKTTVKNNVELEGRMTSFFFCFFLPSDDLVHPWNLEAVSPFRWATKAQTKPMFMLET